LGKIGTDQLQDYAHRRNSTPQQISKWLIKNID